MLSTGLPKNMWCINVRLILFLKAFDPSDSINYRRTPGRQLMDTLPQWKMSCGTEPLVG